MEGENVSQMQHFSFFLSKNNGGLLRGKKNNQKKGGEVSQERSEKNKGSMCQMGRDSLDAKLFMTPAKRIGLAETKDAKKRKRNSIGKETSRKAPRTIAL